MKTTFKYILISILLTGILFSPATAQFPEPTSARDGTPAEITLSLPEAGAQLNALSFSEGFEDISLLPGNGWAFINKSNPLGPLGWFQGNSNVFSAHAGEPNHYIAANFNNTSGIGTISNWLIMPTRLLENGNILTFYTRAVPQGFPDRLEVRMSTAGGSVNVGSGALDVGDFNTLLLSVNPDLTANGYPTVWTRYSIELHLPEPVEGRLAFRYFVTNAGPSGSNANYIGIDSVSFFDGVWETFLPIVTK